MLGSDHGGTEPPALVAVTDIDVGKHHVQFLNRDWLAGGATNMDRVQCLS